MNITFLAHSGFLIELQNLVLLFDWWKGELPALPEEKPLLVLVSHHHPDHFSPAVFSLAQPGRDIRFMLGKDIRLSPGRCRQWGVTDALKERCTSLGGGRREEPFPGVIVETMTSTDDGVAFLVTAEGRTIYHAGDLNWWHWEGEPEPWNPDMERHYKEYTKPLHGRHVDLAMVPMDPRLGQPAEQLGLSYLLGIAQIDKVLPMHQWGDYTPTARFASSFPQWADRLIPICQEGQHFRLP